MIATFSSFVLVNLLYLLEKHETIYFSNVIKIKMVLHTKLYLVCFEEKGRIRNDLEMHIYEIKNNPPLPTKGLVESHAEQWFSYPSNEQNK